MNPFSVVRKGNRLPSFLVFALVLVMAVTSIGKSIQSSNTIYFVIKPRLSNELLTQIANRLKSKNIIVTYQHLDFDAGHLTSITVRIDVAVPGKRASSYTLTEKINSGKFEPLVFYYVPGKERVGFVRGTSDELTASEKRLTNKNLVGLLINDGGDREVIGHWQSN